MDIEKVEKILGRPRPPAVNTRAILIGGADDGTTILIPEHIESIRAGGPDGPEYVKRYHGVFVIKGHPGVTAARRGYFDLDALKGDEAAAQATADRLAADLTAVLKRDWPNLDDRTIRADNYTDGLRPGRIAVLVRALTPDDEEETP